MESQTIMNLLEDRTNQQSKFRTKKCVEINDESRKAYKKNNGNNNKKQL